MKPKVFISHTDRVPEDKAFTDQVVQHLKDNGIPYWIDREHHLPETMTDGAAGPAPENPLFHRLCEAIAGCDVLLFIVSRTSISREFVRLEFDPRVLYGPAAHILENETAVMALLNTPDSMEIVTVLTMLCGPNNVIDMEGKPFDSFWERFEQFYRNAGVLTKDNTWRQRSNFVPRPLPKKPDKDERNELARQGEALFEQALACIAEGRWDHAEELLDDAYQAFRIADDPRAIAQVLYQSYKVHLHLGLEILKQDRQIKEMDGLVIRDSHVLGLQDVVHALKCLEGSIAHFAKAGDQASAIKMATIVQETEEALKDAGIQNAKAMLAALQRRHAKDFVEMITKPPSDTEP